MQSVTCQNLHQVTTYVVVLVNRRALNFGAGRFSLFNFTVDVMHWTHLSLKCSS